MVLLIALSKELIEDLQRMYRDSELNNQKIEVYDHNNKKFKTTSCQNLRVGDLIKVRDRVPADCVVLHTFKDSPELFIKTDQLDGETDWKQKRAVNAV